MAVNPIAVTPPDTPLDPGSLDNGNVGRTLKALRVRKGLSMRELAALADVSQPFLSKVENGLSHPSIATLYRLADALQVPAQDLLPAVDGDVDVQRSQIRRPDATVEGEHASQSTLLVGGPGRIVEARRMTLVDRDDEASWFEHHGEEFVQVLRGCVEIEFADGRSETLNETESLWYRSTLAHRWTNRWTTASEVLIVNARLPFTA